MTADALAKYIATLPTLPCGCTVGHEHLCPVARALWEKIAGRPGTDDRPREPGLWSKYSSAPGIFHDEYFAAAREFLAHFGNGREQQEQEPVPVCQMGLGL